MENYVDTWNRQTICGLELTKLALEDGEAVLRIRVNDDCNFPDAEPEWKTCHVNPSDLHSWIAGFTVIPQGIGNGVDCEVTIEIQTDDGFVTLDVDLYGGLHDAYLFWTNDGGYDDPELDQIQMQEHCDGEKTPANLEAQKQLETGKYVMAMVIDYFTTLFKRHLPLSFIQGLEVFQTQAHDYETYLIELPEETVKRLDQE